MTHRKKQQKPSPNKGSKMTQKCCGERDARHCMRKRPGMHVTSEDPRPNIVVPHYEKDCKCFSCQWVQETESCFIQSKTGLSKVPYTVVNPTHKRVPRDERQRLMTPVQKKKFQIMYIYAMKLENGTWGWVVVLPRPLLPFLLTGEKYSRISRFVRHPVRGWFGIQDNGQRVVMDQEMVPPLYNPFYQHYGYDPQCSPYRLYRPPIEDNASSNETNPSSGDQTALDSDRISRSTGRLTNQSAEFQASTPPEVQATSSQPPADQPTSNNEECMWLNNEEWWPADPRCANPSQASGPCNDNCKVAHHNGKYYGVRCGNQYANWWNTTIFVGGLDPGVTRDDLHARFEGFGEILYVRKQDGATSAHVQFAGRKEAEMAVSQMQGYPIRGARLRLSWGQPKQQIDQRYWDLYVHSAWVARGAAKNSENGCGTLSQGGRQTIGYDDFSRQVVDAWVLLLDKTKH